MAARGETLLPSGIRSFPGYPYTDYAEELLVAGSNPGAMDPRFTDLSHKKRPSDKVPTMVCSALVFLTVIAWADVLQEYMTLKDSTEEEELLLGLGARRHERLYRRLIFASVVTLATFIIVGWLTHC